MSEVKMSSEEVPEKFVHWLLAMGCPEEKVPTLEKISEMCRGQYYMVWRNLIERVHAQDEIKNKRLQVFCDDVRKSQKKSLLSEKGATTVVPEQIALCKQQNELRQKVSQAKERVSIAQRDLEQVMDKISSKMAQRNLIRQKVEDASRRVWLLRQVAADLQGKKTNLEETRSIAESLCSIDEDGDIQNKLEKCLTAFRRQHSNQDCNVTASSISSNNGESDLDSLVWAVTKCRGDLLCAQLLEKRSQLVKRLDAGEEKKSEKDKITAQHVLAHTAAMHCRLALEATKNKVHLKQTEEKLLDAITELSRYLSRTACERLVERCEQAQVSGRVSALRRLAGELAGGAGVFAAGGEPRSHNTVSAATITTNIENKKVELKRVISTLMATERKIDNSKECLSAVFAALRRGAQPPNNYRGVQLDMPLVPIASLREYYDTRRQRRRQKVDISLELEVSDSSAIDLIDYSNPRFLDELRIYLKKFNLDKNRQLVLDNGEKIWQFETQNASIHRLYEQCVSGELSCSLVCPSSGLAQCLTHLVTLVAARTDLKAKLETLKEVPRVKEIDISSQKEEENHIVDRTKKRLQESLQELQKVNKSLLISDENLKFWASNKARKYISDARTVDGMTYREYEHYYLENCMDL